MRQLHPATRAARNVILRALDIYDGLAFGRSPPFPPRQMRLAITDQIRKTSVPRFRESGSAQLEMLQKLGGLTPADSVLDFGCGCGRVALPMTRFLSERSQYVGLDVDASMIEWCHTRIENRYPNFRFAVLGAANRVYNPHSAVRPEHEPFPIRAESLSFAFLLSVFTHLTEPDLRHYLAEIRRVTQPGGTCYATFFLDNPETRSRAVASGNARVLRHEKGVYNVADPDTPELGVSYKQDFVQAVFAEHGFDIRHVILGSWSGQRTAKYQFQDVVVATRT